MTISKELMLAILSMDSYNQGYGKGLDHGKTQIGSANIVKDSEQVFLDPNAPEGTPTEAKDAGFYAVSYDTDYGTVISYRGTDNEISLANLNPWSDAQGGDIWNGYGSAAGSSNTNQAHLAAEFYQAVTETSDSDPRTGSALLTGHSLGGGLAGLIGAMYHQEALLFDNMPFEAAAKDAYDIATTPLSSTISNLIWGDFYNELDAWAPKIADNLKTYAVTGGSLSPITNSTFFASAIKRLPLYSPIL